ncbi:exodeoxyribonuclease V subunit beta [Shewanella sp. AS1]|uniref:exodeoxyribonuclease V subunit beta n=1 Tax=Shewanella sp. AS1 TaxID=2907626 RepID=UPI001F1918D2|nr:exodeoxyribonuclease V subunit beta [Shewanella sp. AS1]MCE9678827.1 exodeoxyribonuclease V subunit beta [Shewanella sp. AS1]
MSQTQEVRKMAKRSEKLDTLTLPLSGSRLIEASAGTGKTFTIAGLYVRLLLGDEQTRPLSCEEILVVTFTNAATGELRDRIRKKIKLAYRRFIGIPVDDALIEQLYQQTPPDKLALARKRLDLALKSLDEAAIFTIHGFCQRMLADMAFEASQLFESEFTLDDSEFLHHAVRDFWRETCYPLPAYLAQLIGDKFSDPDGLAQQIRPLLGAAQATVYPSPRDFTKTAESLSQSLSRLKLIWPRERDALAANLLQLPLNGQRFGKKELGYPKLADLLSSLDNWVSFGHALPPSKVLEQLSLNNLKLNKGGVLPTAQEAPLLAHIEQLNELIGQFIPGFLFAAKQGIARRFAAQKQEKNLLTPDDLLSKLAEALSQSNTAADKMSLASAIAKRFPIALIDEFQDTDPLQYQIFSQIYQQKENCEQQIQNPSLLMIGDPKQAIYAFRGADINTYIAARSQTAHHYSLDTNYRSSRNMVAGVNRLFSQHADPFISQAIPFEPVSPSPFADNKRLIEQTDNPSALRIKLLGEDPELGLNKTTARKLLAQDSCNEIARLLSESQKGHCFNGDKPLKAKDIAVLVRDRNEAAFIKDALSERQIGAVFLSRDSVFSTLEAREMALVLIAIANPKDERALRSAMATELLGYSAEAINQFNLDEEHRQNLLEAFAQLNQLWLKRGIMPSLMAMAQTTHLIERLLASQDGERRLTDFRHLGELLQQKSTELDGIHALLNWYQQTLLDSQSGEEAQLRLESEQNLVQIVTIHKSKGLEYPVCFLPFVSLSRDFRRKPAPMLYHKDDELIWDIEQSDDGWLQYKQETLAEDLRLLYVALTRPALCCYLYIANHSRVNKSGISSQLHQTAIGYLLGIEDANCDLALIQARAATLINNEIASDAISVQTISSIAPPAPLAKQSDERGQLSAKPLHRAATTPWRVGSYSGLVKNMPHERVTPGGDDEIFPEAAPLVSELPPSESRFSFDRGANAGSFMHLVLEEIDFTQAERDLPIQLPRAMEQYGIDDHWQAMLLDWYLDLLKAPLTAAMQTDKSQALSLCQLSPKQTLVEMEFYMPITQLQAKALTELLGQFGYPMTLEFDTLQGMLKGFIDLTFEHDGCFYIADYKSNHLGNDFADYDKAAMGQAIASHRYDLQYIIYSLALHRYLRLRLPDYHYETHFGGCYYLFLRGMSAVHPGCGIFFDKPPEALITALDDLLTLGEAVSTHRNSPDDAPYQTELML